MQVVIAGTVDDDQLLSLRFGDSFLQDVPTKLENALCDIFWQADMQLRLIEAFGAGSNDPVDFALVGDISPEGFRLQEAQAGHTRFQIDQIAAKLGL